MKFYRMNKDHRVFDRNGNFVEYLVCNELLTEAEMKRKNIPVTKHMEQVEIKKTDTHWFFGARFENK